MQICELTKNFVTLHWEARDPDAHKGDFGRLLCITGSGTMPGACCMSTQGALRGGAGLTTVATARENIDRLAAQIPEAMWLPLDTDADGFFLDQPNRTRLQEAIDKATGILLGCGVGMTTETQSLMLWILEQTQEKTVVIDADGLNCLSANREALPITPKPWILTPHPGEMARLMGTTTKEIQENRMECAEEFIHNVPVTLVLKGSKTLICTYKDPDILYQNTTGNPGMSRGGSGDVLAGLTAGMMLGLYHAQAREAEVAAMAVYLHGRAGDLAAEQYSQQAMLPREILACLPQAFLEIETA